MTRPDKHELYERSVQETSADIALIVRVFQKERGRRPVRLREDFCGTAKLCADWVNHHTERSAVGLDLDPQTLDWGRRRHVEPLGPGASRVSLLCQDVREPVSGPVDVTVAFNFSYCVFKERRGLGEYFAAVREGLASDGAFILDIHGGPDAQRETLETKRLHGFTYVWEQRPLDALSAYAKRYIHFRLRDGQELRRAFTYDWRIWTLPELRDLLADVGFTRVDVHWEGSDTRGRGNGIFRRVERAENQDSWIAYVVAWR